MNSIIESPFRQVTITPKSGFIIRINTLKIVNGVLVGSLQVTCEGETVTFPVNTWTQVGTIDIHPPSTIQVMALNPGDCYYFGVVSIIADGTISVYPKITARSAYFSFSNPMT